MESSCAILGLLLLLQMTAILVLLNPLYDVRKVTNFVNKLSKTHKKYYFVTVVSYFFFIIYSGMYLPLKNIYSLLSTNIFNEYEKLMVLRRVEKNYLIAGFSLFLFFVLYGLRSLVTYVATLLELLAAGDTLIKQSKIKAQKLDPLNILPNLLRLKRSISYEAILFSNEIRDQLKTLLRNADHPHDSCTISKILNDKHVDL